MAKYASRMALNKKATDFLRRNLKANNDRVSILVAAIFVDIRLRTLIASELNPTRTAKSELVKMLKDERWTSSRLLDWARRLSIISSEQKGKLSILSRWRNDIAHEMRYWTSPPDSRTRQSLRSACESAIQFLEQSSRYPYPSSTT